MTRPKWPHDNVRAPAWRVRELGYAEPWVVGVQTCSALREFKSTGKLIKKLLELFSRESWFSGAEFQRRAPQSPDSFLTSSPRAGKGVEGWGRKLEAPEHPH